MKIRVMSIALLAVATGVLLLLSTPALAAELVNEGTVVGDPCTGVAINDAGVGVGYCTGSDNKKHAFFNTNVRGSVQTELPPQAGGSDCQPSDINDASPPQTVGQCKSDRKLALGIAWKQTTASAPIVLKPLAGLLGITPDNQSYAIAVNDQGTALGYSVSVLDFSTPVVWIGTDVATALKAPLTGGAIGSVANCTVVGINDEATPSIVGNCPLLLGGAKKAVLWTSPTRAYVELPVPSTASSCSAVAVNNVGHVAGTCVFADAVNKAVRWAPGGRTAPLVMDRVVDVYGNSHPFSNAIAMDGDGNIVGTYQTIAPMGTHAMHWKNLGLSNIGSGTDSARYTEGPTVAVALGSNGNVLYTSTGFLGRPLAAYGRFDQGDQRDVGDPTYSSRYVAISRKGCYAIGTAQLNGGSDRAVYTRFSKSEASRC